MTVVVDATVVVAALIDAGPDGEWSRDVLVSGPLAAPHLMPVEVANILRRASERGDVTGDSAALAHADLTALPVELFPYWGTAERVWELRRNLTCHDAWYVALAEGLDAPLGTLDVKLAAAPSVRCAFLTPMS
jgi:predicted nucleic acid-binding protein